MSNNKDINLKQIIKTSINTLLFVITEQLKILLNIDNLIKSDNKIFKNNIDLIKIIKVCNIKKKKYVKFY